MSHDANVYDLDGCDPDNWPHRLHTELTASWIAQGCHEGEAELFAIVDLVAIARNTYPTLTPREEFQRLIEDEHRSFPDAYPSAQRPRHGHLGEVVDLQAHQNSTRPRTPPSFA